MGINAKAKHSLRVFETRVLGQTVGPKRGEIQENGENCLLRRLLMYIPKMNEYIMGGACKTCISKEK